MIDCIALSPWLVYIEYRDLGGKAIHGYIWQSTIRYLNYQIYSNRPEHWFFIAYWIIEWPNMLVLCYIEKTLLSELRSWLCITGLAYWLIISRQRSTVSLLYGLLLEMCGFLVGAVFHPMLKTLPICTGTCIVICFFHSLLNSHLTLVSR